MDASLPREPRSAHRFAFDVMRSTASATPWWRSQADRAPHSACIVSVRGAAVRIAAIATTLSVNEYTNDRVVSDASATSPKVEAASSRSQMRCVSRSELDHSPCTYRSSSPSTVHAQKPAPAHSSAASA